MSFLTYFQQAFQNGQLLKCTLAKPTVAAPEGLKNIYIRPVSLKKGLYLAFNYRYKTRDEVKNFPLTEAVEQLAKILGSQFMQADLLTPERDYTLQFDRSGASKLTDKKPSMPQVTPAPMAHDRAKQRLLDPKSPWLHLLGITNAKGEVLSSSQDKWKQINKYLEIIDSLLREQPLPSGARIADMGSGKGYLTFALYDYLANHLKLEPHITGIELRPELVDFCRKLARQAGFEHLDFVAKDIADYNEGLLDMLIALHACDTATDLALAAGIRQKARILVVAPCCHKQIRREMQPRNEMKPLLKHGILLERQAEMLTDGIRALLLEAEGYHTKVFEFVSTEHTAKNVMITATLGQRKMNQRSTEALQQIADLKTAFGIREHWLEKLLANK
ncbi:MAG TPA: SAM-dependent methyltransferase [Saprospirales bacterium]|nr:SAM-dependent methyltransferase [Saprospirales bacterium]